MDNRYAVLLRGVNVGGKRTVPREEFHGVLQGLGAFDITIYINSGNAVCQFPSAIDSSTVRSALEKHFGFSVPTLVIPGKQILKIAESIAESLRNDSLTVTKEGQKSDVLYLFPDIDQPDVLDRIGYRPEVEMMEYVPGAVITSISRANQSKGSIHKLVGTKLYTHMTIRNVNTARKLAELVAELEY